jgi:hypothetical protein
MVLILSLPYMVRIMKPTLTAKFNYLWLALAQKIFLCVLCGLCG